MPRCLRGFMRMNKYFASVLAVVAATALSLGAAEIRVSLLEDTNVLNETGALLLQNGSSSESVEAFKKAVRYHKTDFFDRSRFPKEESGFYRFKNVDELNGAIPDPFALIRPRTISLITAWFAWTWSSSSSRTLVRKLRDLKKISARNVLRGNKITEPVQSLTTSSVR